ncbi:glutaredoxin [Pleomassaria siparia CBS 279.74]|uniref:Glutaredoxin n=1 Tax=Pleomassaria siparia CBS 279.74 TaxID=1314801 RepID=A0A6G1K937_9PLEO|nr:glutaredoxin [Pleomassaria siparia CBS 279.74]
MPSQRRMRVFALVIVVAIITTLYMTGSARQTRSSDFYTKTQTELQAREYERATKLRDADDVSARLKAAETAAKEVANEKVKKFQNSVDGGSDEKSVAGRLMMKDQDSTKKQVPGVANVGGRPRDREAAKPEAETQEEHEVEVELNAILKKSPIIIFSKSYCPHSADAKRILLKKYKIVPEPHVVELDQHPMGARLQAILGDTTGRRTVPNVLVIGKSIGGGDDIIELHQTNKLLQTIKSMGGSRIVEAELRDAGSRSEMRRRA